MTLTSGKVETAQSRRTITVHRNREATAIGRIFVKHWLLSRRRPDLVEPGEWCISELIGNAIRHTSCPLFVVNMYPNDGSPLFEVWDSSQKMPNWPLEPCFEDLGAESGRGLGLVVTVSEDCGSYRRDLLQGGGKFVWFRLQTPHAG